MILGATMIVTAEAFVLAEKLGLSHQALFDVASTSSGQSWSLTTYCPVPGPVPASPANNGYKPGFAAALMLKDLKLAQEAALASGAATPLGAEAAQLYALFNAAGHAGDDFSGIINFFARSEVKKQERSDCVSSVESGSVDAWLFLTIFLSTTKRALTHSDASGRADRFCARFPAPVQKED